MRIVDQRAFGRRVAERRKALFPSQAALAAAVGMTQQGIDSIESGDVARPRLLQELARALRTSEEWLLWAEGPENVDYGDGTTFNEPESLERIIKTVSELVEAVAKMVELHAKSTKRPAVKTDARKSVHRAIDMKREHERRSK